MNMTRLARWFGRTLMGHRRTGPDPITPSDLGELARRVLEYGDAYGDRSALHAQLPELADWYAVAKRSDDPGLMDVYDQELHRLAES